MDIGTNQFQNTNALRNSRGRLGFSNLTEDERRETLEAHKRQYAVQDTGEGTLSFAQIVETHNRDWCDNPQKPDREPPKELFNFELILNNRKFQVVLDTLIRIRKEEDLSDYSEIKLKECLEKCAAYRITCFCAYISAHKEYCKWKEYHKVWLAAKRTAARTYIRDDRLIDKGVRNRKEIGTITKDEVDDWIIVKHGSEYRDNERMLQYWEDNEKMFLEFRDVLRDRAMHLQSLLNRVKDHTAPKTSSAE